MEKAKKLKKMLKINCIYLFSFFAFIAGSVGKYDNTFSLYLSPVSSLKAMHDDDCTCVNV